MYYNIFFKMLKIKINPLPQCSGIQHNAMERALTTEQIIEHNLRISDKYHNLQYFISSMSAWFKNNPEKNFKDAELMLRHAKFETHLFAKKMSKAQQDYLSGDGKRQIKLSHNEIPKTYECIYSCRPAKYALEEVLSVWSSYEENLNALEDTGTVFVDGDGEIDQLEQLDKDEAYKKLGDDEKELSKKILDATGLLEFIEISVEETLEQVINQIKEQYGKEPEPLLYGIKKNGGPIFAFTINKKIVHNIGYAIFYDDDGTKIIEIVQLS